MRCSDLSATLLHRSLCPPKPHPTMHQGLACECIHHCQCRHWPPNALYCATPNISVAYEPKAPTRSVIALPNRRLCPHSTVLLTYGRHSFLHAHSLQRGAPFPFPSLVKTSAVYPCSQTCFVSARLRAWPPRSLPLRPPPVDFRPVHRSTRAPSFTTGAAQQGRCGLGGAFPGTRAQARRHHIHNEERA